MATQLAGAPPARGTALLVGDEELVRMSTADMLGELGYAVIEAASGEEAMRLVDGGRRFDLLVTDHLMPGITGTDLVRAVRSDRPGVPVLLVSGYAESRANVDRPEDFTAVVGERIQALARPYDQVTSSNWVPGSLRDLVLLEAGAYLGKKADRVVLDGVDVLLEPQAFTTVALVVHELMTNSAKYGALCDSASRVDVRWERDAFDYLVIHWRESGGPAVRAPTQRGFGTTIIERSIPYKLKGEAEVRYELTGLRARFVVPPAYVRAAPPKQAQLASHEPSPMKRLDGTVLVVEDNMIIALEAEEVLSALGADAVDMAASVREALRLIEASRPDRAVLDVNLGSETSEPVARRLVELGILFAFATGYGESFKVPPDLGDVPVVKKPYGADELRHAFP